MPTTTKYRLRMFTMTHRSKPWTSYKLMYRRYVIEKKTEQEIADEFKVDQATINRWLKKLEIKK